MYVYVVVGMRLVRYVSMHACVLRVGVVEVLLLVNRRTTNMHRTRNTTSKSNNNNNKNTHHPQKIPKTNKTNKTLGAEYAFRLAQDQVPPHKLLPTPRTDVKWMQANEALDKKTQDILARCVFGFLLCFFVLLCVCVVSVCFVFFFGGGGGMMVWYEGKTTPRT
jgi:ABC-type microcin C transport system permease subunit YejE